MNTTRLHSVIRTARGPLSRKDPEGFSPLACEAIAAILRQGPPGSVVHKSYRVRDVNHLAQRDEATRFVFTAWPGKRIDRVKTVRQVVEARA
jgi:hypothetical protein